MYINVLATLTRRFSDHLFVRKGARSFDGWFIEISSNDLTEEERAHLFRMPREPNVFLTTTQPRYQLWNGDKVYPSKYVFRKVVPIEILSEREAIDLDETDPDRIIVRDAALAAASLLQSDLTMRDAARALIRIDASNQRRALDQARRIARELYAALETGVVTDPMLQRHIDVMWREYGDNK